MKILVLSPSPQPLLEVIAATGDAVVTTEAPLNADEIAAMAPDLAVSHGYRHILRGPVIAAVPGGIVNLHISLLPWNRGADPNFWSFLEGTPKGVSIHHIDEGVDTGDLIAQREVAFGPGETLATSYRALQTVILALFAETWPAIRAGTAPRRPQTGLGTLHRLRDKQPYLHLLADGWDTPVAVLDDWGRTHGLFRQ